MDLADRVQRVRLLLDTLNDPYPSPHTSLEPDSGPAPSRYVPCETCRRRGWIRRRQGETLCLGCDGRGWRRRAHDDVAWDAYLEMPLDEAAELGRESLPARLPAEGEPPYVWERLLHLYERHGSYRELRRRLDALALSHPHRYRLVRAVLVDHEPRRLDERAALELELGVVHLAMRMRAVRVPAWLWERSAAAENRSIESLAAMGMKPGKIALALGITRERVKRTLRHQRQKKPSDSLRPKASLR